MNPVINDHTEINDPALLVASNTIVSLRYCMKNVDGEEIENTFGGQPIEYLHGSGRISPELEAQLTGLKAGDKHSLTIKRPDIFHFNIEIVAVRLATAAELQSGRPQKDCGPGCCC